MTVHRTMVAIMTTAYLTQTDSATMAAATGLTGKMSAQATTEVTDSSIRTLMKMESGNKINTIMFGIIVFLVLGINVLGTMTGGNDRWG